MKAMAELDGKQFKSVADEDALPQTEEEKKGRPGEGRGRKAPCWRP